MNKPPAQRVIRQDPIACAHCDAKEVRIQRHRKTSTRSLATVRITVECAKCGGAFEIALAEGALNSAGTRTGLFGTTTLFSSANAEPAKPRKTRTPDLEPAAFEALAERLKHIVQPENDEHLQSIRHGYPATDKQTRALRHRTKLSDPDMVRIGIRLGLLSPQCEQATHEPQPFRWLTSREASALFEIDKALSDSDPNQPETTPDTERSATKLTVVR